VPFGPHEASVAAGLSRAVSRPRGRELDLAIAASAISWGAALWTLNRRDFEDVPELDLWPG
jgi:predicted nucleic acid-binding protein